MVFAMVGQPITELGHEALRVADARASVRWPGQKMDSDARDSGSTRSVWTTDYNDDKPRKRVIGSEVCAAR